MQTARQTTNPRSIWRRSPPLRPHQPKASTNINHQDHRPSQQDPPLFFTRLIVAGRQPSMAPGVPLVLPHLPIASKLMPKLNYSPLQLQHCCLSFLLLAPAPAIRRASTRQRLPSLLGVNVGVSPVWLQCFPLRRFLRKFSKSWTTPHFDFKIVAYPSSSWHPPLPFVASTRLDTLPSWGILQSWAHKKPFIHTNALKMKYLQLQNCSCPFHPRMFGFTRGLYTTTTKSVLPGRIGLVHITPVTPTAKYTTINIYAGIEIDPNFWDWRLDGVSCEFRPLFECLYPSGGLRIDGHTRIGYPKDKSTSKHNNIYMYVTSAS